jgi:hypothetical protein
MNGSFPNHSPDRFTVNPNSDDHWHNFPVSMRTSPTTLVYSPQSGMVNDAYNNSSGLDLRLSSGTVGYGGGRLHVTGSKTIGIQSYIEGLRVTPLSGFVVFDNIFYNYVADADYNTPIT